MVENRTSNINSPAPLPVSDQLALLHWGRWDISLVTVKHFWLYTISILYANTTYIYYRKDLVLEPDLHWLRLKTSALRLRISQQIHLSMFNLLVIKSPFTLNMNFHQQKSHKNLCEQIWLIHIKICTLLQNIHESEKISRLTLSSAEFCLQKQTVGPMRCFV